MADLDQRVAQLNRLAPLERALATLDTRLAAAGDGLVGLNDKLDAIERDMAAEQQGNRAWRGAVETELTQLRAGVVDLPLGLAELGERLEQLGHAGSLSLQAVRDLALDSVPSSQPGPRLSISVVLTTCDRPRLLERALDSIRAQTRRPDAVLVVDDGARSAADVIAQYGELGVTFLRTPAPHSGPSAARNLGLDQLATDLVTFLDDDNIMWRSWIELGSTYLERDAETDIVYGAQIRGIESVLAGNIWLHQPYDHDALARENFIDLSQMMHRASACRFDERLRRFVDWDYILRLSATAPERSARVDAIASIYSTSESSRVTVPGWPPDLPQLVRQRRLDHGEGRSEARTCSCCGFVGAFGPGPDGRPEATCPRCLSLERHRFLAVLGPYLYSFWIPETRRNERCTLVEIAPSPATSAFRAMFGKSLTIDADPSADGRVVDLVASLTSVPLADSSVDVMVVLHVLEHIPDDRAAMREIARLLRPSGLGVLQVPLSGRPETDEDVLSSASERIARYGQADHVRVYGEDYFSRLHEHGLTVMTVSPKQSLPVELVRKFGLLPDQGLDLVVRSNSELAQSRLAQFVSALRQGSAV